MKRFLILTAVLMICVLPLLSCTQQGENAVGTAEGEQQPMERQSGEQKPDEQKPDGQQAGEQKPKGPPPSVVVVAQLEAGEAEPMTEFVGTVFYARSSEVSAEVNGKVTRVYYEEGDRVNKGQQLVSLSTDLLSKELEATRGTYGQVSEQLKKAEKDLKRVEPLYKEGSIAEALYDEYFYRVEGLKNEAASLKARLEGLELELQKKTIRAPFSGVVLERKVEKGEWMSPGGVVAMLADDSALDVMIDVPENSVAFMERTRRFDIKAGGKSFKGELISVIPKGDIATRTFAVKLRLRNVAGLLEGMEARAMLPTGPRSEGLLINRDALVNFAGMQVIYAVAEGMAKMIPVQITGYDGMRASVTGPGLEPGMMVVVKGNERLFQGGMPVMVQNAGEGPAKAASGGPDPMTEETK